MREGASRPSLMPSSALTSGAAIGTPVGIVGVWWLNTHVLAAPMPLEVATAAGSIIVCVAGYIVQLLEAFLTHVRS